MKDKLIILFLCCIWIVLAVLSFSSNTEITKEHCEKYIKGADAEIKYQLYRNEIFMDKIDELNGVIIKLENKVGLPHREPDYNTCYKQE